MSDRAGMASHHPDARPRQEVGPASGGSWSTASNWSPSGVPGANSLVSITGASVTVSSSVTVSEISLINDAVLTVAPNGNRVLRTSGLFFSYHSSYPTLNLNDNDLIIDYAAAAGSRPLWSEPGTHGIAAYRHRQQRGQWNSCSSHHPPPPRHVLTTLGAGEASESLASPPGSQPSPSSLRSDRRRDYGL